jgi:hypothetical protein
MPASEDDHRWDGGSRVRRFAKTIHLNVCSRDGRQLRARQCPRTFGASCTHVGFDGPSIVKLRCKPTSLPRTGPVAVRNSRHFRAARSRPARYWKSHYERRSNNPHCRGISSRHTHAGPCRQNKAAESRARREYPHATMAKNLGPRRRGTHRFTRVCDPSLSRLFVEF